MTESTQKTSLYKLNLNNPSIIEVLKVYLIKPNFYIID